MGIAIYRHGRVKASACTPRRRRRRAAPRPKGFELSQNGFVHWPKKIRSASDTFLKDTDGRACVTRVLWTATRAI